MSQGRSAARPASRRSSRSPARASERSRAQQDDARSRPLRGRGGVGVAQGDGRGQQSGSRTSDSRELSSSAGPHGVLSEQPTSATQQASQLAMGAGHYGTEGSPTRPFVYQASSSDPRQPSNPTVPPTTTPADPPASAERGSPQAVHPYPQAARRILTPRSPRAASLGRAALRTAEAQHVTTTLPAPHPRGFVTAHDAPGHGGGPSPLAGFGQLHTSAQGQGPAAPPTTRPASGPARSLSQPSLSLGFPPAPPQEPLQPGGLKREHSGRPVLSGPPFPSAVPPSMAHSTPGFLGNPRWGTSLMASSLPAGGVRNVPNMEVPPLLAITPERGEEIVVAVDMHQGSKQADEKRQRNAGASARFRQRKKEREREQQEGLQRLESQNRELEQRVEQLARRCQELEEERDFYRNDRNRLRDIVSRTPGIQELADRGPPSPASRSGPSFAPERGALFAHPLPAAATQPHASSPYAHPQAQQPLHHPRSSSYVDPSMLEPPARRRRTDSEPQLPTSSYSLMAPTALPPITAPPPPPPVPSLGMAPSPHITPPPPLGSARLPPLRFDRSRTPSMTPPPVPGGAPPPPVPPPSGSPYPTLGRLPYEAGWATEPRGQAEGQGGPQSQR